MLPSLIDSIDSQIHTIEWLSRNKKWSRIVVWCSCRVATTLTMLYVIDLLRFRTESIMYQSFFIFMMISIFAGSNDSMLRVGHSSIPRPKRETLKIELYHTFGPKWFGFVIDFYQLFEVSFQWLFGIIICMQIYRTEPQKFENLGKCIYAEQIYN